MASGLPSTRETEGRRTLGLFRRDRKSAGDEPLDPAIADVEDGADADGGADVEDAAAAEPSDAGATDAGTDAGATDAGTADAADQG